MTIVQVLGIGVAAIVGFAVLRSNPTRSINRGFVLLSIVVCAWLLSLAQIDPRDPQIVFWIRMTNAAAAYLPWSLWILKETLTGAPFDARTFRRSWPWLVIAVGLAALCFTNQFIPSGSTPEHPLVGWGKTVFSLAIAAEYIGLLALATRQMRRHTGIQRVELQFLVYGGAAAGLGGIFLSALGTWLDLQELRRQEPLLIVVFYSFTAWAVTSKKVFDAEHLFRSTLKTIVHVVAIFAVLVVSLYLGEIYLPEPFVLAVSSLAVVLVFQLLQRWNAFFGPGDEVSEDARRKLLVVSRAEAGWPELEAMFCEILSRWGRSEQAHLWNAPAPPVPPAASLPISVEEAIVRAKWSTPEKLQREILAEQPSELRDYMREQRVGVMVAGPTSPGKPTLIIALELRHDRRPFTFLDVHFVQDAAAIIEGCITRVQLSQQARDAEQLATAGLLGSSLAHEIRNPLVTIKSVVHAATARFNEPEFRRLLVDVLPGEIDRIEALLSGLMDLGRPRLPEFEELHMNAVIESSLKLVLPKAKENNVTIFQQLAATDDVLTADKGSLRQIILNLVMNAIDAVAHQSGDRIVTVQTRSVAKNIVLEIADNGPGISEAVRITLFRPFSKSSKTSGMGLGLAICADIARSHHGEIILVDRGGGGAIFRVTLPCQQPSS